MHPVERQRLEAFAAAGRQRIDQGIGIIQALLREYSGHPLLLLDLAELLLKKPDYEGARERIQEAAPKAEERLLSRLAHLWQLAGNRQEALAVLKRGAAVSPALRLEWAMALERLNRLEDSEKVLGTLAGSALPGAGWLKARLRRRQGDIGVAVESLRALLANPGGPGGEFRARAGYELAAALDELGDYAGAFQALMETKREIATAMPRPAAADWERRLSAEHRVRGQLLADSSRLRRWKASAPAGGGGEFPPLTVLTGHPRSGTTLVERQLSGCPGFTGVSEEQFFRTAIERETSGVLRHAGESPLEVLDRLEPSMVGRVRRLYAAFLGQRLNGGSRALIDKEPSYLDYLPVLLRFAPELRVLVIHRDPRDVLLSSLFVPVPVSNVSAWAWLDPGKAARRLCQVREAWARQREVWPGDLLEIHYEDLVRNPEAVLPEVRKFVGLEEGPEASSTADEFISSPSYARAGKAVDDRSAGRWRKYAEQLAPWMTDPGFGGGA